MSALVNIGNALYGAVVGNPSLVQILDDYGNTLVQFDAVPSENYSVQADITKNPVEDGSVIGDHTIRKPYALDLTGIISDAALPVRQRVMSEAATIAASAALPPLTIVAAAAALATWRAHQNSESPSIAAYRTLVQIAVGDPTANPPLPPRAVTVKTRLGMFDNMLLSEISVPRDATTGQGLIFTLKCEQVTIVYPQTISVTDLDRPELAAAKEKVGKKEAESLNGAPDGFAEQQRELNFLRKAIK